MQMMMNNSNAEALKAKGLLPTATSSMQFRNLGPQGFAFGPSRELFPLLRSLGFRV